MFLKNKKILITAGPTWVAVDKIRVISNIATGQTGIALAEKLQYCGAKVTLILGPVGSYSLNKKIKLIRFSFFNQLRCILRKELRLGKYNVIIHSAAVSDFRPKKYIKGKLDSSRDLNLKLVALPKIIRDIRKAASGAILVMFKLETGISDQILIRRARLAGKIYGADMVIANRICPRYKAFILDSKNVYAQASSKNDLIEKLAQIFTDTSLLLNCN